MEAYQRSIETRVEASTTPVPLVALSERLTFQSSDSLRANNTTGGTIPVEARSAIRVGGRLALLSEGTEGVEDRFRGCFATQPYDPSPEAL